MFDPNYEQPNYSALASGFKLYLVAMRRLIKSRLNDAYTVTLWDLQQGVEKQVLGRHSERIEGLAFSRDGRTLFSVSYERVIAWDLSSGQSRRNLIAGAFSAALSPSGDLLACGGNEMVKLWDTSSWQEVKRLQGEWAFADSVSFSPIGHLLAVSGNHEPDVSVFDVASGRQIHALGGHSNGVLCSAFSLDGRMLANDMFLNKGIIAWRLDKRQTFLVGSLVC
jgi:WD40 repeat protein